MKNIQKQRPCIPTWFLIIAIACASLAASPVVAQSPHSTNEPNCRFGINHNRQLGDLSNVAVTSLRAGNFIDYGATTTFTPAGMTLLRMVRLIQPDKNSNDYIVSPSESDITAIAQSNPGSIWLIGNEPDRVFYQDDIMPAAYARAYHELYNLLKTADPTARIVAGNIVQVTPLRIEYLDKVLSAHRSMYGTRMPVDIWGIHAFILREKLNDWGASIPPGSTATEGWLLTPEQNADINLFKQQIVDFRNWMYQNGYHDRPLYVTEYGVLIGPDWGFTPDVVSNYMVQTFDYMLSATSTKTGYPGDNYRLVQHFSWYSVNDKLRDTNNDGQYDEGFNGYLFDPENGNQRTAMGDAYANYTAGLSPETNLKPVRIEFDPATPLGTNQPVTVTIKVKVANAGNTSSAQPFTLKLYNGDPSQGGQLLTGAEFNGALPGCGDSQWFTYTWSTVATGSSSVYAVVTPGAGVVDVDPSNKKTSRTVVFATDILYLPTLNQQQP